MKKLWEEFVLSLLVALLLPAAALGIALLCTPQKVYYPDTPPTQAAQTPVYLPVLFRNPEVEELDMDTYLVGVLLGEMPQDFEEDALKAQAVAARTFARKAYETGGKHLDGSVCAEPGCCQAYISPESYLEKGGTQAGIEKMKAAVQETSGYVLTYDGNLIEATYFSSSGGSTEEAVAVWGQEFPYLQAVSSPEAVSEYTRNFTYEQLNTLLGCGIPSDSSGFVGVVTRTKGEGVDSISLGGTSYTGLELRKKLGLRSTNFQVEPLADGIKITTLGYGHRVGMSQYGADALAAAGYTWQEILSHYYPGTVLLRLSSEEPGSHEKPELID